LIYLVDLSLSEWTAAILSDVASTLFSGGWRLGETEGTSLAQADSSAIDNRFGDEESSFFSLW
jgi:hypothetical protein